MSNRDRQAESKVDLGIALILGAVAFLVYLWSIMPGAYPGEPASLVVDALGVKPKLSANNMLWGLLVRAVATLRPDNMVFRVNIMSAIFGAVSVGLLYLVVARLWDRFIDEGLLARMHASRRLKGDRIIRNAIILGGVSASLALAYSIPFWIASTQSYYHTFYVAWLLASALAFLQYIRSGQPLWAFVFALLHGAGMSQTSAFAAFLPLFGLTLLYFIWRNNHLSLNMVASLLGVGILGGCLVFANAALFFDSEGFHLMSYGGFFQVVRVLVGSLWSGVTGSLPRVGWLILVGLSIAPWLAAMLAASRALNDKQDWSFYVLHTAIAIVTLAVVINIKASPWNFFGVSDTTIIPYLLTSITYGYIATYAYLLIAHFFETQDSAKLARASGVLRATAAIVFPLVAISAAAANLRQTDHRDSRFIALYTDRLLDSVEGRPWLVTNGVLDDVVLLRAKERQLPLRCINLADNTSTIAIRYFKKHTDNIRLKNTAELGFISMLQEWISAGPEATKELALCLVPDLWGAGDYEMIPNGFVFLGGQEEDIKALRVESIIKKHSELWDEMEEALSRAEKSHSESIKFYAERIIRPQTSFIGNNLGFLLESLGFQEEAFAIFERIHALDPSNVSALLNWATMVFNGHSPDRKDQVVSDLDALNKRLEGSQLPIWSLSRVFGYVTRPETFAQLGWSWANSGQPNLASRALSRAEKSLPPEQRTAIRTGLAQLHLLQDRPEESERVYKDMLVEDAANRRAIMGLLRIYTLRGDIELAREFMQRAEKAGVPKEQLLISRAMLAQAAGEIPLARSLLQEQIDLNPGHTQALAVMCAILVQEKDPNALRIMVDKLEQAAGPDSYQTLIARGSMHELAGDRRAARDSFLRAFRFMPSAVAIMDRVLRLDFQLADKAAAVEHARAMLRLDLRHGFANYLLGSIAAERRDYASAEDFLRLSVEVEPTVGNLNDLADVLLRLGQVEEAEIRINQAFKMDDQRYEAWDTYGMILLEKGKLDDAELALNTSLKLFADDLRVHLHLAELYYLKKDLPRAAELVRSISKEANALPRGDWEKFEDLHLKVLGQKFTVKKQ